MGIRLKSMGPFIDSKVSTISGFSANINRLLRKLPRRWEVGKKDEKGEKDMGKNCAKSGIRVRLHGPFGLGYHYFLERGFKDQILGRIET